MTARYEARGVRCLECTALDLRSHPEQAKSGTGQCGAAEPPIFVSAVMARNCMPFEAAAPDVVEARDNWAKGLKMFWQR